MTVRVRTLFLIGVTLLFVWFIYLERGILRPFIVAAIFAYIFNPFVNFFSQRMKLPRTLSVTIVYIFLISLIIGLSIIITQRISSDSDDIRSYATTLLNTANTQLDSFPDWTKPTINDALMVFKKDHFFSPTSIVPYFPQAISRIVSVIIFIFSGFYLLKDGGKGIEWLLRLVPKDYRTEVEGMLKKINNVLSDYLRGQLLLVFLMSIFTFVALYIIGVRFAAIIAIFSGFAEIVPVIGPILAASVAMLVVLITGTANFGLLPLHAAVVVAITYFVLRHLEDYFVIPQVMGKITKLPPFIVFFAVIAGGHLWGILGLILAVPTAAIMKILLEYSFEYINMPHRRRKASGSE